MTLAMEIARTNISEFDKTVSVLENMTDEELHTLRNVAMVIANKNAGDRPIRRLTEEEFFLKVDEGLADVEAGKYIISESAEAEIAAEFGLA
jgi:hypothetical protein